MGKTLNIGSAYTLQEAFCHSFGLNRAANIAAEEGSNRST